MSFRLTFLHTSPVHVATFDRLLTQIAPDIPIRHVVDEELLSEARNAGFVTPRLRGRIAARIQDQAEPGVVLCTCSTIGGTAEALGQSMGKVVMRVDRPMAEQAVELDSRIVVAAALRSTLAPTRDLLLAVAREAGKEITIMEVLCDAAWSRFEQGDQAGYLQEVAASLKEAASLGDVVVLAQASMAGALALLADMPTAVLSSPRSGLEAAVNVYRQQVKGLTRSSEPEI